MKAKTKNKNPHGWFFLYVQTIPGYDKKFAKAIREGIVFDYSGITDSLSELYENHLAIYAKMEAELKAEMRGAKFKLENRLNSQRRALFALIHKTLQHRNYEYTKDQVKAIACRACGVERLNDASEAVVIRAIKGFEKSEKEAWVTNLLNNIAESVV